jgi:hypothetical protein
MKRIIGSVAICVLLLGVSIQAQAPQGPPKPGPEVKRLAYFVGNWKEEGKSTAHGMTGPVSSTQKWEWVSGGFFIVGHSDNKSPVGDFKIMAVCLTSVIIFLTLPRGRYVAAPDQST